MKFIIEETVTIPEIALLHQTLVYTETQATPNPVFADAQWRSILWLDELLSKTFDPNLYEVIRQEKLTFSDD